WALPPPGLRSRKKLANAGGSGRRLGLFDPPSASSSTPDTWHFLTSGRGSGRSCRDSQRRRTPAEGGGQPPGRRTGRAPSTPQAQPPRLSQPRPAPTPLAPGHAASRPCRSASVWIVLTPNCRARFLATCRPAVVRGGAAAVHRVLRGLAVRQARGPERGQGAVEEARPAALGRPGPQ